MIAYYERSARALDQHMTECLRDAIMCPYCAAVVLRHEVKDLNSLFVYCEFSGTADALPAAVEQPWNKHWIRTDQKGIAVDGSHGAQRVKICLDSDKGPDGRETRARLRRNYMSPLVQMNKPGNKNTCSLM